MFLRFSDDGESQGILCDVLFLLYQGKYNEPSAFLLVYGKYGEVGFLDLLTNQLLELLEFAKYHQVKG